MRLGLEKDLEKLHNDIVIMTEHIEESIDDMVMALKNKDLELARKVIEKDDVIDYLEKDIERSCINIIARQNPTAKDLRDITSVLKMITDLERIGDHCSDISKIVIDLDGQDYIKELIHIPQMAKIIKKMVKDVTSSYVEKDIELAKIVCKTDDEIDDLYSLIKTEIEEIISKDGNKVHQGIALILIAKYLERMADHTTNVGEWIIYNITGKRKKYN